MSDSKADAELPAVLISPPWLRGESRPSPIVIHSLPKVDFEERAHWNEKEREEALEPFKGWSNPSRMLGADLRDIPLYEVHGLDDETALELWNETHPAKWCYAMQRDVLAIMARFGVAGAQGLIRYSTLSPSYGYQALIKLESPRVAPLVSQWATKSTALGGWGKEWLLEYPDAAIVGLLPIALGEMGVERAAAESAIRLIAHHEPERVRKGAARFGDAAQAGIEALISADPLLSYPDPMPKLPKWWRTPSVMKPRLINGPELPDKAIEALALMLRFTPVDPPYAGLEEVRQACTPSSLDAFAWHIAALWIENGSSPAAYWALHGLGHLGGELSARELAKMIWIWPKQRGLAKAKLGVEVLTRMGSDAALMHLDRLARNIRKKALKEHAQQAIREVAQSRGLTADELGDRLAPTLDLDGDAEELDFGSRKLSVRFDEALRPYAVDESGKRAKSVRTLKGDDSVKAKIAVSLWKGLQKDAKSCAKHQIRRLERALSDSRRWSVSEFNKFFAHHPLLTYLARRLLWATFGEDGRVVNTFRVAEDSSLADINDDEWELSHWSTVGLAHPLDLETDALTAWRRVFADYEIIQPFPQLERPLFRPTDDEARADRLERFEKLEVYTGRFLALDLLGWSKGGIEGGWIRSYSKEIGDEREILIIFGPGMWVTNPMEEELQVIESVRLRPSGAFGELPPVIFSEIVHTLEGLRS